MIFRPPHELGVGLGLGLGFGLGLWFGLGLLPWLRLRFDLNEI